MTVRQTARGIGIRALLLLAAVVIVGIWLVSIAFDLIGAAIHIAIWLVIAVVVFIAIAVARHKMRRR
jgi:heme A synthase